MTSLVGGYRVPKTHPRLEAYGTVDELNAFIGLLIEELEDKDARTLLSFVQSKLFTVGAYLATDPSKSSFKVESRISDDCIRKIEAAIDAIDHELPKLKAFVLPRGTRAAALAHVCRTVCRRAERTIYRVNETEEVDGFVLVFLNRLSDLLFVISRKECIDKKGEEFFWDNTCQ